LAPRTDELPSVINFNVVVVGDTGVGKTSLIKNYTGQTFDPNESKTVGLDLQKLDIQRDGKTLSVQFFDTAGADKFQPKSKPYYDNADTQAIVLVYDITNYESFQHLDKWLKDVQSKLPEERNAQFLVLGNKIDQKNKVAVQGSVAMAWADQHNFLFQQCSASSSEGIQDAVNKVVDAVYEVKYRPRVLVEKISLEEFGGDTTVAPKGPAPRAEEEEDDDDERLPEQQEESGCCIIA